VEKREKEWDRTTEIESYQDKIQALAKEKIMTAKTLVYRKNEHERIPRWLK
jgi:hypothetical protein